MKIFLAVVAVVSLSAAPAAPTASPEQRLPQPSGICDWFPNLPGCQWRK